MVIGIPNPELLNEFLDGVELDLFELHQAERVEREQREAVDPRPSFDPMEGSGVEVEGPLSVEVSSQVS